MTSAPDRPLPSSRVRERSLSDLDIPVGARTLRNLRDRHRVIE